MEGLTTSDNERFDPHFLYHHFVKGSFNRSHHTRDSSLTVTPDMPHAKSAITHHFGIGIGLAFNSVTLGPPSRVLWGVFVFTFVSRPPFRFFCLRANSSVGSRDSVSLYLTGTSLGALSQRLFLPYINMHAHPHHHTLSYQ